MRNNSPNKPNNFHLACHISTDSTESCCSGSKLSPNKLDLFPSKYVKLLATGNRGHYSPLLFIQSTTFPSIFRLRFPGPPLDQLPFTLSIRLVKASKLSCLANSVQLLLPKSHPYPFPRRMKKKRTLSTSGSQL